MKTRIKRNLFLVITIIILVILGLQNQSFAMGNPYSYDGGFNCTYYAWQRAKDKLQVEMSGWGNAGTWADSARAEGYTVDKNPSADSIAVWPCSDYWLTFEGVSYYYGKGHVAFVEWVNGGTMHISESNWAGKSYNEQDISTTDARGYCDSPQFIHLKETAPKITWMTVNIQDGVTDSFDVRIWAESEKPLKGIELKVWKSGVNTPVPHNATYDTNLKCWRSMFLGSEIPGWTSNTSNVCCVTAVATNAEDKKSNEVHIYDTPVGGRETQAGNFTARIVPVANKNYAVKLTGNNNGSAIQLANKSETDKYQLWKFTKVSGDYYEITNVQNGKVITVLNAGDSDGNDLIGWDDNNSGHARFLLQKYQDGYRIVAGNSGVLRAMDVNGGSFTAGTKIQEYSNGNTQYNRAQTFTFEKIADGLRLNKTSAEVNVGNTLSLSATITPTDVATKKLTWKSSNTAVATVDSNGKVTGKADGTATITATTTDGSNISKTCTIKVIEDKYDSSAKLTINKSTYQFNSLNSTLQLEAKLSTGKGTSITWSSSNTDVATVSSDGLVTAKRGGFTYITAKSKYYGELSCWIYVSYPVTLSDGSKAYVGDIDGNGMFDANDSAEILDMFKTNDKSADSKLLGDIDGNGVADANDSALIMEIFKTEAFKPGNLATIRRVDLSKSKVELEIGESEKISASVVASNTTQSKTITWSSNNTSVATVDSNGKITAKGAGTAVITAKSSNGKTATCEAAVVTKRYANVSYTTHVQKEGWQDYVSNGAMSGTTGKSLRLEGIKIKVDSNVTGKIYYQTQIQGIGWQSWRNNNQMSGTSGQSKRLEAIKISLSGELANKYDVYYRVHAQKLGWLDWAKNGAPAGSAGYSYRLEGIEIKLVEKGKAAPGATTHCFEQKDPTISYTTHVQKIGWQKYVTNGAISGTLGKSLRLEGIKIKVNNVGITGDVEYCTQIQGIGWQSFVKNDEMSGTSGQSKRLEAIKIRLTGELAQKYDIYYRVHSQQFGWLGWAKNGESAGTQGYSYRLEGIQIKLVKKGGAAPGSTANTFKKK